MIPSFLSQLNRLLRNQDDISTLFDPLKQSNVYYELNQHLQQISSDSYVRTIRSSWLTSNPVMMDFVLAYFNFLKQSSPQPDDDEVSLAARTYARIEECFKAAEKVFAQPDAAYFVPTLRKFTTALVNAALHTGRISGDISLTKAGEAARLLGRPLSLASSDRSTDDDTPGKRDALFFLANATFKLYFALNNLRLCDTVINNTSSGLSGIDRVGKADRTAYYYYRGRIYLYQRRLGQARRELQKAFDLCSNRNPKNARIIFLYLTVASLPLGIFPTFAALDYFNLSLQFAPVLVALKRGDFKHVREALLAHQEFHLRKGNYLLLQSKLEVLCWRNLIRRTILIVSNGIPNPSAGGPPSLDLRQLLICAKESFVESVGTTVETEMDVDDVEMMCVSLMDQGYIKGYILHSKKLLVLQKGPLFGFPPISSVKPI